MSYSSDKIKVSDNADIPVFFVVVMDLNGNVLYQTDAVNPIKHTALDLNSVIYEKEATIDISTYPKGLYFVKVNNHRFKKLLKY
jgi:hypothetical protein